MIAIVMGVSGSGKSTVGKLLAERLGWDFVDADDYHPASSIEKMRRGIPLDDSDRAPWLAKLAQELEMWLSQRNNVVLACSALKSKYRDSLLRGSVEVRFIYLKGNFELFEGRLSKRKGHFMSKELLMSQFDSLEEPDDAIEADASKAPGDIVSDLIGELTP